MLWGLIGTCFEGPESVGLLVTPQPGAVTSLSMHCFGETHSQEPRTPWEAANLQTSGHPKEEEDSKCNWG